MLKPIDSFQVKLPDFEGPLDLLLYLIEREELDITRVSLAKVTGAYLEYIHILESLQVDQVADFLVIASKLLLIKSAALLPRPPEIKAEEEEDVGDDLVRQLLLYKQYKESARKLGDREAAGLHTYIRVAPPPKIEAKLDLSNITVDMLIKAVRNVLEIEPSSPPVGTVVKPYTLTIRDQMNLIERILRYRPDISFKRMLRRARDRVEIIVTFLAVLELLRRRKVDVVQEQLFGDILIIPVPEPPPAGASIDDEEESVFEIPKAPLDQSDDIGISEEEDDEFAAEERAAFTGTAANESAPGEIQQIPKPDPEAPTAEDRPDA
jgi:segregation and condensation protein A